MTGRTAHDALLRVLVDARLRRGLPAETLGEEEAAVLRRADPDRLLRLARFMARHFYRERVVRLLPHACAVARRFGKRPVSQVDTPAFLALLDEAVLGSPETADAVASWMERWFLEAVPPPTAPAWWPDLVRYEGAMFRAEAAPRVFRGPTPAAVPDRPRRAAAARLVEVGFDLPALLARLDRLGTEDPLPPEVPPTPTRLLAATSRRGVLRVVRMNDVLDRLLVAIDGERDAAAIAAACGMTPAGAATSLATLFDLGAIEA